MIYNKIYKAISEGVIKSLQIDNVDNQPVNYSHSKVNNSIYSKEEFNTAVEEFIKNSNIDTYNNILKYSMHGINQYKVQNVYKMELIFEKIYDITSKPNLSWIDLSNIIGLTFILENGDEVLLDDIDNVNNVMFIKFENFRIFKHPIIIHKNLLMNEKKWSNPIQSYINTKVEDEKDGYKNTYNTNIINDLNNYPAFEYCVNQSIKGYEAYLPAIEELKFLYTYKELVNYILKYTNGMELNDIRSIIFLSSTEFVAFATFLGNGIPFHKSKTDSGKIIPFFRKIE